MQIDNDLKMLALFSSAFALKEDTSEEVVEKFKSFVEKYSIEEVDEDLMDFTIEEFVPWLEKTIIKFQVAIEEYNALER